MDNNLVFYSMIFALPVVLLLGFLVGVYYNLIKASRKKKGLVFISYITQKNNLPPRFQNCIVKEKPLNWQIKQNGLTKDINYKVISWQAITDEDAKLYLDTKGQVNEERSLHR